jgi:hypothetical protein
VPVIKKPVQRQVLQAIFASVAREETAAFGTFGARRRGLRRAAVHSPG